MNAIIEPDDKEILTVGDMLLHGDPFAYWPPTYRNPLVNCLSPIASNRLSELNAEVAHYLEAFEISIADPTTEPDPKIFLANVFKHFSTNTSLWTKLWESDAVWKSVSIKFLQQVGPEWNGILEDWSTDTTIAYDSIVIDLKRAYDCVCSEIEWKLTPPRPVSENEVKGTHTFSPQPQLTNDNPCLEIWCDKNHEEPKIPEEVFMRSAIQRDWKLCLQSISELQESLFHAGLNVHGDGWRVVKKPLLGWFNKIDSLVSSNTQDRTEVHLWLRLGNLCFSPGYCGISQSSTQEAVARLVKEAQKQIGILRKDVREKGTALDFAFYSEAVDILRSHCSWWQCIKPLLLAFRELKEPAIAPDLRFRTERGMRTQPPEPMSRLAIWIANLLANPALRNQREVDPDLKGIREEFAAFCISRLKTKDDTQGELSDNSFMEPNPIWRSCYARASLELRMNPRGTSHRLALWSSQNDPSLEVRDSASKLYESLRHQKAIDPGLSPRRPLMAAYWWIRQAHLRSLGITIDKRGAQRTRSKDLRWTEGIDKANRPNLNVNR